MLDPCNTFTAYKEAAGKNHISDLLSDRIGFTGQEGFIDLTLT